jgi:hypothetical protein
MFVIPVPFLKEHKAMLAHVKELMEYQNGYVAIPPTRHYKLIVALRTTAVENGEGSLDKEATNHDDLFDAFRLSLMFWHWLKERCKYPRIRHSMVHQNCLQWA